MEKFVVNLSVKHFHFLAEDRELRRKKEKQEVRREEVETVRARKTVTGKALQCMCGGRCVRKTKRKEK